MTTTFLKLSKPLTGDATGPADTVYYSHKGVSIIEWDLDSEVGNTQLWVHHGDGCPGLVCVYVYVYSRNML